MILLIPQEDKTIFNSTQPEPQVIAEAIAAYQYNNEKRQTRGLAILDAVTIPCITMVGTRPTFYLVPVTQALSNAIVTGQYPETPTKVVKCVTFLGHNRRSREGMETPAYRRVAFQRVVTFRKNIGRHSLSDCVTCISSMFATSGIRYLTRLTARNFRFPISVVLL
ncbi:hypothetical protein M378DRAFT_1045391 [Amanita muscaria Koide BX008]|uniref:Uncharacterized protein n=1 Tax=Amanita muscaria (strain Koide BX008) TaxID=946122 RepID=A0A0C2RWJ9_AMAMK|nr:hypothetical protein M378DRAFT_1052267 [Amanita muscaria Koide BX008]KIL55276.1 hypothetical protein M378DRAFT_1045391 [Amanita muscaria Koide BX008]